MEDLVFKKVAIKYGDNIFSYKNEFIYNNESMDGTGFLRNRNSAKEYIEKSLLNETEDVDGRKVTSTQFLAIRKSDKRIVGMIQIRHFLNDYLLQYGAHISFTPRDSMHLMDMGITEGSVWRKETLLFYTGVRKAIIEAGNKIIINDTIPLYLAEKPL
jgi:hypothetical protein